MTVTIKHDVLKLQESFKRQSWTIIEILHPQYENKLQMMELSLDVKESLIIFCKFISENKWRVPCPQSVDHPCKYFWNYLTTRENKNRPYNIFSSIENVIALLKSLGIVLSISKS